MKILRIPATTRWFKPLYNKQLGEKIKILWQHAKINSPILTVFAPPSAILFLITAPILIYHKINRPQQPRYFEYIVIFRPDDPRVKEINKSDTLRYGRAWFSRSFLEPY